MLPGGEKVAEIPQPATTDALRSLPRIENSPKSPCWQQVQIAKQNSWMATRQAGKAVVYEAPCMIDPKVQPLPAPARPAEAARGTS